MSSVLLYLAIVLMWLCVLVPMWLRRDKAVPLEFYHDVESDISDEQSRGDGPAEEEFASASVSSSAGRPSPSLPVPSPSVSASCAPPHSRTSVQAPVTGGARVRSGRPPARRRRAERRRRARRMAKRRRLTLWCVLLLLASAVTAAVKLIPWWGVAPSVLLLGLYLAILRVSARVEAEERRRAAARARAERLRRARRRAEFEAQRAAEIIDLAVRRDELFDQYAVPPRRAVGD